MRFPRSRVTPRTSWITVAAAATTLLVVGAYQASRWLEWREACLMMVEIHADREQEQRIKLDEAEVARTEGRLPDNPLVPVYIHLARARLGFHGEMRRKWELASRRPWTPVLDDPEEPTDDRIVKKLGPLKPLPYFTDDVKYIAVDPPADR